MRKLPLGVAVSTAVHAAAVAWIATRAVAHPPAPAFKAATPIEIVAVAPPPPTPPLPLDVVLLDDPPPAASQAPPSPRRSAPAITAPGPRGAEERPGPRSPTTTPAAGEPGSPGPTTSPKAHPWMAMRRGEVPHLALPTGRWDPLDHPPDGSAPELPRTTGILHESGRGSYESDQGGFLGRVNPDGTVKLRDKPSASIHLALPTPRSLGYAIADWYEAEKGPFGETTVMPGSKQIQLSMGTSTDPGDQAHPEHMLK
ncbi:MAG TPA: hypothetical protein VLM79_12625, partial [Kofleriaceae bacterium]|nr:hypothetical protein [Kofleriaceae bacterium]